MGKETVIAEFGDRPLYKSVLAIQFCETAVQCNHLSHTDTAESNPEKGKGPARLFCLYEIPENLRKFFKLI